MENKTRKRKLWVRILSIVCLVCVFMSMLWSRYNTASAIATPYDAVGSLLLELSFYFAGLAAGEESSDIVKENPYKDSGNSITSNNARENYIKECFPKNKMIDFGWNDISYQKFVTSLGSLWAGGSYILRMEFCDKIWQNLPTDGSAALKPESFVMNKEGASILQFPNPSPEPDDDEDDEEKAEILKLFNPQTNSIVNSAFTGIFSTKAFMTVYKALLKANANEMEQKFSSSGVECDYRVDFWKEHPDILTIGGNNFEYTYDLQFKLSNLPAQSLNPGDLIYPLTFILDNVPQIGFSSNGAYNSSGYYNCLFYEMTRLSPLNSSGKYQYLRFGDYSPVFCPSGNGTHEHGPFPGVGVTSSLAKEYMDAFRSRVLLDPNQTDVRVWDEYLIDVGNLSNFQKWNETVDSGNYVLKDLLKLMKKGWEIEINDGEKEWEGIKNNGETAKEALAQPELAPKYEETPGRVSFDSIVKGIESQLELDLPNGQPAFEFLGDPTPGTQMEPARDLYPGSEYGTLPGNDSGVKDSWWGQDYDISPGGSDGSGGGSGNDGNKPYVPGIDGTDADGGAINWYQRFPFCIPWDIYHFINVFNGQKKAPKWDIPFKIKRLGVDEKITFDISEYEEVVKVIRVFMLLFYSSGLVLITRNIIKG